VAASVTLYSWRHRNTEGAILFTWHIGLISILAFSEGLSLLGSTPAQALFWFNIRFISIAGMPLTWLLFAFRYTGWHAWLTPRRMAGLAVIPVVTQVMIWTNGMHGLWVRRQVEFFRAGPFMIADTSARVSSIWFWVHAAYSYTLSSLALILIVYAALRSATSPRRHVAAVVFGAFCIIGSTILPTFQLIPDLMINPTVPATIRLWT
jgi:hypothetical protein